MKYNIELALLIAKEIESFIAPKGYHCAIGGSCMYRGGSDKDVDIIIYPHKTGSYDMNDVLECLDMMDDLNVDMDNIYHSIIEASKDENTGKITARLIYKAKYKNTPVDLFFFADVLS